MSDAIAVAKRALGLLDLTNLNDTCTEADIEALCTRAVTPHGTVAAVCIWPQFVPLARKLLKGSGVKVATVVNFPGGDGTPVDVTYDISNALQAGAHEVDVVMPYRTLIDGHLERLSHFLEGCSVEARRRTMKVILETGELKDPRLIIQASKLALDAGADFIKTSTGKTPVSATREAVGLMLLSIKAWKPKKAGIKPSGGIRNTADAAAYLALADLVMGPDWATPKTFRFGASGLLDDLLATLEGKSAATRTAAY
jgi:deoxyribose-phosphate aldolase